MNTRGIIQGHCGFDDNDYFKCSTEYVHNVVCYHDCTCIYMYIHVYTCVYILYIHVLMRDEKEGGKKQASLRSKKNNKAKKQHI